MHKTLKGLYAITDATQNNAQQLTADVEQALLGGARIIQFRDKSTNRQQRLETAAELRELTRQHDALLIINDDVKLARQSHADGVHLGRDDASISDARAQLGATAVIGTSCYNDIALAKQAASNGANYVAFGRFFPSRSKPQAAQADIETLRTAQHEIDIPVVAIGGITADNGARLINAGAHMLAVIDDIFSQADIKGAAQRYQKLFNTPY